MGNCLKVGAEEGKFEVSNAREGKQSFKVPLMCADL